MRVLRSSKCSVCGKVHDEWPALAWTSPMAYNELTQEEKSSMAELDSDFCLIQYPDQIDRFIRVTLDQKVNDHCDVLSYGVWVSLSESNFEDYSAKYGDPDSEEVKYFGWLSNSIPGYPITLNIPMTIITRKGNLRPEAMPHSDSPHPFVADYYSGISVVEAERRIMEMLGNVAHRSTDEPSN
jgi:hypothetical protein